MHRLTLLSVDLACVLLAISISEFMVSDLPIQIDSGAVLNHNIAFLCSALVAFHVLGLNKSIWRFADTSDYASVISAVSLATICAVLVAYANGGLDLLPKILIVLQLLLSILFMCIGRAGTQLRHAMRSNNGRFEKAGLFENDTVLVLGVNWLSGLLLKTMRDVKGNRPVVAGIVGPKRQHRGRLFQNYPILGTAEELDHILHDLERHGLSVGRIVVTTPLNQLSDYARRALSATQAHGKISIQYLAENNAFIQKAFRSHQQFGAGMPPSAANSRFSLSHDLHNHVSRRPFWTIKRLIDCLLSAIAIVAALPLFLIVGMIVLLDVGMPIFFWQQRPGRLGRAFRVYKFRTMKADRTSPDELRASPIGHLIRRSRLDELPQLFNILFGQMSFVGPRPLLPIDQSVAHSARLAVRPGLTGWAQVNGGREISKVDKAAMDVWYVHNASFLLDFSIMLRTIRMVILGERPNVRNIQRAWAYLKFTTSAPSNISEDNFVEGREITRRVA